MTPPLYRRAGEPDATTLSRLGRATFRETFGHLYPEEDLAEYLDRAYDPEETRRTLGDPSWASWIVESPAGQPLGFATAGPCSLPHPAVSGASLELKRFYLVRAAQSRGLGGVLFDQVMAWMAERSPPDIWIGVWSENDGAQRFYARRGFETIGEYGFPVGRTLDREFILRRRPAF